MMKSNKTFLITSAVVLFLALSGTVLAIKISRNSGKDNEATNLQQNILKKKQYDPKLLSRFQLVFNKMNAPQKKIFMTGSLTTIDYSDKPIKSSSLAFVFTKNGSRYYYKLGNTETFNEDSINVYVDHELKKIVLSPPTKDSTTLFSTITKNFVKNLQDEQYDLETRMEGDRQTITMLNNHHISCKEYSVTFDTTSFDVNRIFIRLTNLTDPLKRDNEKHIDFRLNQFYLQERLESFSNRNPLSLQNGQLKVAEKFNSYQLLK